ARRASPGRRAASRHVGPTRRWAAAASRRSARRAWIAVTASPHSIVDAAVVHRRLRPAENSFRYRVAYLCLDLDKVEQARGRWLAIDRPGLISFQRIDHGARDGSPLRPWLRAILGRHGLDDMCDGQVMLMTLPRLLGYVFNPISFWFCRDRGGD